MTDDPREALRKLVYRIRQRSTNKLHNREFAMTLEDCVRELAALSQVGEKGRFKHFAPDGGKAPIRPDAPDHLTIKTSAELAIAGGDEAKKSEGGVQIPFGAMNDDPTAPGFKPGPSYPTADRREIVARIIDPRAFIIANSKRVDIQNRQELALGMAERIIAALDGGVGE